MPRDTDLACDVGCEYHRYRSELMLARSEGLTRIYKRIHDADETAADITKMRELQVQLDHAVAAAYGWEDLQFDHFFRKTQDGPRFTIGAQVRREVLVRLLQLNHERYAEEMGTGLHGRHSQNGRAASNRVRIGARTASTAQLSLTEVGAE
jgi:hypothetical protein